MKLIRHAINARKVAKPRYPENRSQIESHRWRLLAPTLSEEKIWKPKFWFKVIQEPKVDSSLFKNPKVDSAETLLCRAVQQPVLRCHSEESTPFVWGIVNLELMNHHRIIYRDGQLSWERCAGTSEEWSVPPCSGEWSVVVKEEESRTYFLDNWGHLSNNAPVSWLIYVTSS